ncbi:hypothetical protein KQI84_07395 [bacterium]|nr:hypothetical protein [bacterium]
MFFPRLIPALGVLLTLCSISISYAQDNLLALAPEEAEIVARLDVRSAIDSPLFQKVLESYGEEKARNQAKVLQNTTDLDIFTDLQELYLFGIVDRDESIVILARGNFNQEKLLDLVKLNESYQSDKVDGVTVHKWRDGDEKYGAFLDDNLLAFAGSEEAMRVLLDTRNKDHASFMSTPAGKALPNDMNSHDLWFALRSTDNTKGEFGEISHAIDLNHAIATVDLGSSNVSASVQLQPNRKELVENYLQIQQGAVAFAQLLREEEKVIDLLSQRARAEKSEDGKAARLTVEIPNDAALNLIKQAVD